jgi:hypothetical protein
MKIEFSPCLAAPPTISFVLLHHLKDEVSFGCDENPYKLTCLGMMNQICLAKTKKLIGVLALDLVHQLLNEVVVILDHLLLFVVALVEILDLLHRLSQSAAHGHSEAHLLLEAPRRVVAHIGVYVNLQAIRFLAWEVTQLHVPKGRRLLVTENHQHIVSNVTDARLEGGSRSSGVVNMADETLPGTRGPIIEHHVHLPHVASVAKWGLLVEVERLVMAVEGIEHGPQLPQEVTSYLLVIVRVRGSLQQPVELRVLRGFDHD